jgi:hypothetical protein
VGGNVARMGEKRTAYRSFVGNLERKRPLGRPRRRWLNNIKMDHVESNNRSFGGTYRFNHQADKNRRGRNNGSSN